MTTTLPQRHETHTNVAPLVVSKNEITMDEQQQHDVQDIARKLYGRRLGDGGVRPTAALAPMVRASTTPLRTLALRYGADFCYSEELVDRSLSNTVRVDNHELGTIDYVKETSSLSKKTRKKLGTRPCLILRISKHDELPSDDHPYGRLVCQLGTGEPELALEAAQHVYQDVSSIDINMGCPKKFSVSGGMGSALLKDPERASRILKALRNELPQTPIGITSTSNTENTDEKTSTSRWVSPRPVSCKIRLLETTAQTVDFVDAMIGAGANAVALHARRVGHESTVAADWDSLEEVLGLLRPKYRHIPFLVNGDFYNREERQEFVSRTQVDGVLLARPALYNCSTFLPLSTHPHLVDKTTVVQEYLKESVRYDMHHKNIKYVLCEMMTHRRTPPERSLQLPIRFSAGQTIAKTCDCHDIQSLCQLWNVNYSECLQRRKDECARQHKPQKTELLSILIASTDMPTLDSKNAPFVAGEHRYEDSYFLKREPAHNSTRDWKKEVGPNAKRAKLGSWKED